MQRLTLPKLPSKKWLAFYGVVGSITGAAVYDKYAKRQEWTKLENLARPLSEEPLSPFEMPRRVVVCLAPSHNNSLSTARWYFSTYVKPVLNAAAVDYVALQGETPEELRSKVAEYVWKGKRYSLREQAALKYMKEYERRTSLWQLLTAPFRSKIPPFSTFFPSNSLQVEEETQEQVMNRLADELKHGKYASGDIIVAVGRNSYRATLLGLQDGALASPASDGLEKAPDESYFWEEFELPPVAYIPCYQRVGFKNFPNRVYNWFQQRNVVRDVGGRTLSVIMNPSFRPFGVDPVTSCPDEDIGLALEPDEDVREPSVGREPEHRLEVEPSILLDSKVSATLKVQGAC